MRALLVVHDSESHEILRRQLADRGWQVQSFSSIAHLLDSSRAAPVRLVIVEETSRCDGSEGCRAVRREAGGSSTYVIGVSAQTDDNAAQRLLDAGADDLLGLPCAPREVEMRLIVAEGRIGPPGPPSDTSLVAIARRYDEIQRKYHVQRAFLEGLVDSAPEGIVVVDEARRIVRINEEFTRLFGYEVEEALGRSLDELIVPDDLHGQSLEMDGSVRRGERVMLETVRKHRNGSLIEVLVQAKAIDVDGPVGAFGIYTAITERKRQESALRESEARYRALFDQSPVGVFLCDEELQITHCNGYLTRIVGRPYEEIVGSNLKSLKNGRLLPGVRAALGGEPAFYEGPYRGKSGKQLHVSVQYAPLRDDRGTVIGGIGVLKDISDRLAVEKQLRAHAAEMERVNSALRERTLDLEAAMQARSRLYSTMNHELRTPISAVMLYQELLIGGSLGPLGDEQVRALEHSHTATRHLLELVRDILDLSKIEAGKVKVQPIEVDLPALLHELQASVAPLTERYGSELRLEIDEGVGTVVTDPKRVRQILLNFVSNAAKYGRGEAIDLRCEVTPSGEYAIAVMDRGIGIEEKDLSHIFEDFVQLGTAREEGTGLGLAISRSLADLLAARVEVESEPGAGSVFRLVLPASIVPSDGSVGPA